MANEKGEVNMWNQKKFQLALIALGIVHHKKKKYGWFSDQAEKKNICIYEWKEKIF